MAMMGEPLNMNSRKRGYSELDSDSSGASFDLHDDSDFDVGQLITIQQQQQHQQQQQQQSAQLSQVQVQVKHEPQQQQQQQQLLNNHQKQQQHHQLQLQQQQQLHQQQQQQQFDKQFQPHSQQQVSQVPLSSSDQQSQQHSNQQQQDNKPKRNPYCSRCRNHGKSAQVKGHKRHCEYRDCKCEGCQLVECRQIVSAAQIKRRRYQKQDEECGRRIEISPPVLTREPANDPAALIAKTLIGSASMKHQLQQHQAAAAAVAAAQQQQPQSQQQQQQQLHQQQQQHQVATQLSLATTKQLPGALMNPHSHQMHPHLPNIHVSSAAASSALNSALHLFHLPSSVLANAAAVANLPQVAVASSTANSSPTLPSNRKQVSLVDEVFRNFGPLAIYAWLRHEHFDLQKVRQLIELARLPFSELLQTDHSPLDLTSPIDIVD